MWVEHGGGGDSHLEMRIQFRLVKFDIRSVNWNRYSVKGIDYYTVIERTCVIWHGND